MVSLDPSGVKDIKGSRQGCDPETLVPLTWTGLDEGGHGMELGFALQGQAVSRGLRGPQGAQGPENLAGTLYRVN